MQITLDLTLSEAMKIRGGLLKEMIRENKQIKKLRAEGAHHSTVYARQQYENELSSLYNKFCEVSMKIAAEKEI